MQVKELTLDSPDYPERLRHLAAPPSKLYTLGQNVKELVSRPCVAIVGSRKVSAYGITVTSSLAGELARAGVVIISGLAIGVDGISHKAALEAGGLAIAVLPCGLDRIYPARHRELAKQILASGGALVSEYPAGTNIYQVNFLQRNRIVAGLSDAVLITEASERSGTLSTARFALEQGIEVLALPGNITSPTSAGTNNLIKTGAAPITKAEDVLHILGIKSAAASQKTIKSKDPDEQTLLDLLYSGTQDGSELFTRSGLDARKFNQTLTMLEIRGHIRPLGNNNWAVQ